MQELTINAARTLLIPRAQPDVLLVQVGSNGNLDAGAAEASSGRSQIRIFKLADLEAGPKTYTAGDLLGYGIRNNVAIAEDPQGGIVSILPTHLWTTWGTSITRSVQACSLTLKHQPNVSRHC